MLLHADDFSIYDTVNYMLNGVYAEAGGVLWADPDGVSGGKVLCVDEVAPGQNQHNGSIAFRYVLQYGAVQAVGSAFRLWLNVLPNNDNGQVSYCLCDASNNVIATFFVTANGRLAFTIDGVSQTFYTAVPVVTANGWYHLEWKYAVTINNGTNPATATASFEFRIEGVTVLTESNVPCTVHNIGMAKIACANVGRAYTAYIKDLVLWDTSGSLNNDFMGAVIVTDLAPVSDVSLNWTPSIGSNGFSILDNVPPDSTKYITAGLATINKPYAANLSDLPINTTTVRGVISYVRAAKTDGGDGNLQSAVISGGVTDLGANRPITVGQTYWRDIFETDPATNQPWTPGAVNASTLQINRTA